MIRLKFDLTFHRNVKSKARLLLKNQRGRRGLVLSIHDETWPSVLVVQVLSDAWKSNLMAIVF